MLALRKSAEISSRFNAAFNKDGSDLRFATRPGCTGLEVIGRNQTKSRTQGMHLHLTLAVTPTGLPLGVLRCGFGTPHKAQGGKSRRWIDGYRDIAQAAGKLTRGTRVIAVMDREADFWGLFDEQRRRGRVEILVRAKHDRWGGPGCLDSGSANFGWTPQPCSTADGRSTAEKQRDGWFIIISSPLSVASGLCREPPDPTSRGRLA